MYVVRPSSRTSNFQARKRAGAGETRLTGFARHWMLRVMLSAATLKVGESGVVEDVDGADTTALRLLEMGLVSGTSVTLIKTAPTGDPLQFRVRGFHLSLRKAEAQRVRLHKASA